MYLFLLSKTFKIHPLNPQIAKKKSNEKAYRSDESDYIEIHD